ncbi:MAG: TrmH family RNA methyltransferase [Daejeonella sp.]|uniref:TrmH family RNA methyltransferase n=1 Tax=Daejeonella sp. JGW-45 TaxID=3034148 RepID=UPI0023ECDC73|nr:RNA methyltransferase [Daejeonella sp. JGW-45]
MISKSQISFITSLQQKKIRKERGLFIVEGFKSISEFIHSDYVTDTIFYTENVVPKLGNLSQNIKLFEISSNELTKISALSSPQQMLALVKIPEHRGLTTKLLKGSFTLVLDGIQDPGNLGTIIRTADWFGMTNLVCSEDTVDVYNPKVVQATMGSLARVSVEYTDLDKFLAGSSVPVFGALLDGKSIYATNFGTEGIIVLGNEGNGIRPGIMDKITYPVTIPAFGKAESLNVAISASIFCSEIRRNS